MKRILLVDDEDSFRTLYQELLEAKGYNVETSADGQTALNLILQGGYDLILLDVVMPKMDGITVLKQLKKFNTTIPNGPVVMLSVLDQSDFIKTSLSLGASGYINKSYGTPDDVINQIVSLVPND